MTGHRRADSTSNTTETPVAAENAWIARATETVNIARGACQITTFHPKKMRKDGFPVKPVTAMQLVCFNNIWI